MPVSVQDTSAAKSAFQASVSPQGGPTIQTRMQQNSLADEVTSCDFPDAVLLLQENMKTLEDYRERKFEGPLSP